MLTKLNFLICSCILVHVLCVLAATTSSNNFNNIPNCSEKDENINECLKKAFQQMIPRSKNGIPELSIPPMDPFVINRTNYAFSHTIISGKLAVRNLKIHGLTNTITDSVTYTRNGNGAILLVKARIPKVFVEGTYKAKIQINAARINSRGPFNVTISDVDVKLQPEAELYERDGHLYMRLVKFNMDPTLGNMRFYAEGLMPDPLLNEAVLEFINQNWRTIYKNLIPETRAAWEPEFIKLGNEYFSHVPIDAVLSRE